MEPDDIRSLAAANFNECWRLLELPSRSGDDDVELLTCAFTSRRHWREVGNAERLVIADWMVSRAAAATGHGQLAVEFAHRAADGARAPGTEDWMIASAAEGLARAHLAAGDESSAKSEAARAETLVAAIKDPEEQAIIADQLRDLQSLLDQR